MPAEEQMFEELAAASLAEQVPAPDDPDPTRRHGRLRRACVVGQARFERGHVEIDPKDHDTIYADLCRHQPAKDIPAADHETNLRARGRSSGESAGSTSVQPGRMRLSRVSRDPSGCRRPWFSSKTSR